MGFEFYPFVLVFTGFFVVHMGFRIAGELFVERFIAPRLEERRERKRKEANELREWEREYEFALEELDNEFKTFPMGEKA